MRAENSLNRVAANRLSACAVRASHTSPHLTEISNRFERGHAQRAQLMTDHMARAVCLWFWGSTNSSGSTSDCVGFCGRRLHVPLSMAHSLCLGIPLLGERYWVPSPGRGGGIPRGTISVSIEGSVLEKGEFRASDGPLPKELASSTPFSWLFPPGYYIANKLLCRMHD